MKKEFYGYDGQERLVDDPAEVVVALIEGERDYQGFPIKVHVFRPMDPFSDIEKYSKWILDDILETLDDEYGDPDGDHTEATEKMKGAMMELAKVMKAEYKPWMCEPTGEVLEFSRKEAHEIVGDAP